MRRNDQLKCCPRRMLRRSSTHRTLAQLTLQRTPVHRQCARGCRDITLVLVQYVADVFPRCPMYRHRLLTHEHAIVAAITMERRDHLIGARGLGQILSCAELDSLDRRSYARIAGQDHDAHVWIEREKRREKLQPRTIWQLESDYRIPRRIVIDELRRLLGGMRDLHPKPARSERPREDFAQGDVVVNEQQAWSNLGIAMRRDHHRDLFSFLD